MEYILQEYVKLTSLEPEKAVRGRGHHKSRELRLYDKLLEYVKRLKCYAKHIEICGEKRNSYSKTDKDATFMRVKRDYMVMKIKLCKSSFRIFDKKELTTAS